MDQWRLDGAALIAAILDCRDADEVCDLVTNYSNELIDLITRLEERNSAS